MSDSVTISVRDSVSARIEVRGHVLTAGEPADKGGTDDGPTPMEIFLGGLGACVGITLRMYADLKKIPLRGVRVHADQARRKREAIPAERIEAGDERPEIPCVDLRIEVEGDLTDEQVERLRFIAKRCPVHRVLAERPIVHEVLDRKP